MPTLFLLITLFLEPVVMCLTAGSFHFYALDTIIVLSRRQEVPMQDFEQEKAEKAIVPMPAVQMNIWDSMRESDRGVTMSSPFARDPKEEARRQMLAHHKLWLEMIQHEYPSPYEHYRIGVYIRYFNQTKYENYIDYHMQEFIDTIALCPNWELIDFYIDEGQSAPNMENAKEWCHLLQDCTDGRIDLIITQKIGNVSRKPAEITFCARFLATLPRPVGIYFINEDVFTLASYYLEDMREERFLPGGNWQLLPDEPEARGELNE